MQIPNEVSSSRKLRIALTITELEPGGAEKCMTELALFLKTRGHDVRVFSLGPAPSGARATLVEQLLAAGVEVKFGHARTLFDGLRTAKWLRSEILELEPDIVQSMLWHANFISSFALRRNVVPLVGGIRVAEPKRLRWWVQRWIARRFAKFVCVSEDVALHCRENEKINPNKLVVIPNGVNIPIRNGPPKNWTDLGLPENARVILFVGRLEPQKGVVDLMNHADEILAQANGCHLVLFGLGSEENSLREIASRCSHRGRILLAGWRADAQDWMSAAQMVILPATYEGMPNVLLEAMAVSKPVVAFDVHGVEEMFDSAENRELKTAQVIPPGDWVKLASQIARFSADDELRNRIGSFNREHILRNFHLTTQLSQYEALYMNLVLANRLDRNRK